jgi:hypothetical protein
VESHWCVLVVVLVVVVGGGGGGGGVVLVFLSVCLYVHDSTTWKVNLTVSFVLATDRAPHVCFRCTLQATSASAQFQWRFHATILRRWRYFCNTKPQQQNLTMNPFHLQDFFSVLAAAIRKEKEGHDATDGSSSRYATVPH